MKLNGEGEFNMKQRKKLLSILLSLALVVTMIPMMTIPSSADSFTSITVNDADTLWECLNEGGYNIKIGTDISYFQNGTYDHWCWTSGKNILDLNGHIVNISNDNDQNYSTLLRVRGNAELIICDSVGGGELHYNGYINSDGDLRYRNLIEVDGIFTLNGGTLYAGRSKNEYVAKYARNMYKQTFGTTIQVNDGGKTVINGGTLWARGCPPENSEYPKACNLLMKNGAVAVINGGTFIAKSGADSICNYGKDSSLGIVAGEFTCEGLSQILINGTPYNSSPDGHVGMSSGNLARFNGSIEKDKDSVYYSTHVKLTPATEQDEMEITSNAMKKNGCYYPNEKQSTFTYGYDYDTCYYDVFPFSADGYRGADHHMVYYWDIYKAGTTIKVAGTSVRRTGEYEGTFDNTVDLLKDFHPLNSNGDPDNSRTFVPEPGVRYEIECSVYERLGDDFVWSYSIENPEFIFTKSGEARSVEVYYGSATTTSAVQGEPVTIYAAKREHKMFSGWEVISGGVTLDDPGLQSTSFTMGDKDVKVRAKFVDTNYIVATSSLNVRETPSTDGNRIGGLTKDQEVAVVEKRQDGWYKIVFGTGYGWVMSEFLNPLDGGLGPSCPFVDISPGQEWYNAVLWAYYAEPQVTNGIDDTHFGPMKTVTRGQCAAFLWRAMGCPDPKTTYNPFKDVPEWQYYYKPILWAVENGITKGTSADKFSPDQTLSTAHIITFLYRTKNPGKDGWYSEASQWACEGNGGAPFGVKTQVNEYTNCPRGYVVMFLKETESI